jgi:hypothetical protein
MSLIAILVVGAALGIVWRLIGLAVRVVLLIALIALIASYGSHLARHHSPPPSAHHTR